MGLLLVVAIVGGFTLSISGGGVAGVTARRAAAAAFLGSTLSARLHREGAAAGPRAAPSKQQQEKKKRGKLEPPQRVDPLSFGDAGVCGGPGAVPSVEASLAAAAERLDASLEAAFKPYSQVRRGREVGVLCRGVAWRGSRDPPGKRLHDLKACMHAITAGRLALLLAALPASAQGFTLEDIFEAAEALGADGSNDVMLYVEVRGRGEERRGAGSGALVHPPAACRLPPVRCCMHALRATAPRCTPPVPPPQVRNNTVVFPRREGQQCKWFCNDLVPSLRGGFQRGLDAGKLRVPEGLPMLW